MITKKKFIRSTFYVRQKELKEGKNKHPYLKLELCNSQGRVFGYLWDKNCKETYQKVHFDAVVTIIGEEKELNKRKILNISKVEVIPPGPKKEKYALISNEQMTWFSKSLNELKENQKKLVETLFTGKRLCLFFQIPAGKLWGYTQKGGLYQKTAKLLASIEHFVDNEQNKPLMKTAIFLQAIGYTDGIFYENVFEYKTTAKLLSIPTLALSLTSYAIDHSELPPSEKAHLKHLLLMIPKYTSNETVGKSPEAILLYKINDIITTNNALLTRKKDPSNHNRKWSSYLKMLETDIFWG